MEATCYCGWWWNKDFSGDEGREHEWVTCGCIFDTYYALWSCWRETESVTISHQRYDYMLWFSIMEKTIYKHSRGGAKEKKCAGSLSCHVKYKPSRPSWYVWKKTLMKKMYIYAKIIIFLCRCPFELSSGQRSLAALAGCELKVFFGYLEFTGLRLVRNRFCLKISFCPVEQ